MGLAFNHAVLDGTATWHFMSSWAEICRGAQTISTQPFLDRAKARDTRVKLDLASPKDPNASSNGDAAAEPPQLVEKVFKFSDSAIHTIKSRANSVVPSDGSKPFSTFHCGGAESDSCSRRACGRRAERGVGEGAEDISV
ncbi:BnaA02g32750D [Brassica napus]|uniref:BnaA02g32750D protein n=1 Tax=Brassica napus TaxID=3708 RepID=A0A078IAV0_BRANA|nr:BnaA02g32750D [Brassica napus]